MRRVDGRGVEGGRVVWEEGSDCVFGEGYAVIGVEMR